MAGDVARVPRQHQHPRDAEGDHRGQPFRRPVGIWDDANSDKHEPVATIDCWPTRLGVPGGRTVESWAISGVTVASTHAGKGMARAMLEGELRTARDLGIPMASLTVSESSLYGRYGFGAAAMAADYEFNTRRVTWKGPIPDGRVEFISLEKARDTIAELHERLVPNLIGEVDLWPLRIGQLTGTALDEDGRAKKLRAIHYLDADGATRGVAVYKLSGGDTDFMDHAVRIEYLLTETDDAYAALWRYLLHIPLVHKVTAETRSIDEPVRWMITDWRAATVKTWEHQYLRLIDVTTCLEGRGYLTDGEIVLDVSDDLGFAAGRWKLTVADGVGRVAEALDDANTPALTLGIAELSAIYLGGVRAATLVAAGRATGDAVTADRLLAAERTPYLGIWY